MLFGPSGEAEAASSAKTVTVVAEGDGKAGAEGPVNDENLEEGKLDDSQV